jgi:hypothetical protein
VQRLEKQSTNDEDHHLLSALAALVGRRPGTTNNYFGAEVDDIKRFMVILPKRGTKGEIQTDGK